MPLEGQHLNKSSDKESRIPVGTQFSPGVISLPGFLAAIVEHSGDLESLREAIWEPEVRIRRPTKPLLADNEVCRWKLLPSMAF